MFKNLNDFFKLEEFFEECEYTILEYDDNFLAGHVLTSQGFKRFIINIPSIIDSLMLSIFIPDVNGRNYNSLSYAEMIYQKSRDMLPLSTQELKNAYFMVYRLPTTVDGIVRLFKISKVNHGSDIKVVVNNDGLITKSSKDIRVIHCGTYFRHKVSIYNEELVYSSTAINDNENFFYLVLYDPVGYKNYVHNGFLLNPGYNLSGYSQIVKYYERYECAKRTNNKYYYCDSLMQCILDYRFVYRPDEMKLSNFLSLGLILNVILSHNTYLCSIKKFRSYILDNVQLVGAMFEVQMDIELHNQNSDSWYVDRFSDNIVDLLVVGGISTKSILC